MLGAWRLRGGTALPPRAVSAVASLLCNPTAWGASTSPSVGGWRGHKTVGHVRGFRARTILVNRAASINLLSNALDTVYANINRRPFLIQSDSACRKRPFSTGLFSTGIFWSFFLSSVESILYSGVVFMLFLEAVGVREYCCTAVEIGWQLCDSRAFSASNGSANPRPSELVALGLAESRQSYVRGVALSRKPPKLQQAQPLLAAWDRYRALLLSCDTRCWRAD